jgi:quercetin dioxygenase-like cupin family protein
MEPNRRNLLCAAAALLVPRFAQAADAPTSKTLFEHTLPKVSLDGWNVTAVEVSYPPGGASPSHRHSGITVAYVLEGEVRSKVGDQPEKTYRVGEMFFENPNELHAVSRNASETKPARLLAMLFAPAGQPITTRA